MIGSVGYSAWTGLVYLYFASNTGTGLKTTGYSVLNDPPGANGDYFGQSLALGDINKDGLADLVIGAPGVSNSEGATYVYMAHPTTGISSNASPTQSLSDPRVYSGDQFGDMIAMADINADGYIDVAIGSRGYSNSSIAQGAIYVYITSPSTGLPTSYTTRLFTPTVSSYVDFGNWVALGNTRGTGFNDLVGGAVNTNSTQGAAYYFESSTSGVASTTTHNYTDPGGANNDSFANAIVITDWNGDGAGDMAVCANGSDSLAGLAYIYFSTPTTGLPASATQTLINPAGTTSADLFGYPVASLIFPSLQPHAGALRLW